MRFDPRSPAWGFDPVTKTFSAEASSIGWPAGRIPTEFEFFSPVTNTTVFMEGHRIQRNAEGEPCVFEFRSRRIDTADPRVSTRQTIIARVFND